MRQSLSAVWYMLVGLALRIVYLSYTPPNVRTFDLFEGGGHIDYINYISQHWLPPNAASGWEFHQPPLYYYLAAVARSIWNVSGGNNDLLMLQLFSVSASMIFLYFGIRTIELFLDSHIAKSVASFLFVCWPAAIIHSARIGPDPLFYALYAASFFYAARWFRADQSRDLKFAVVFAFFCGLARSNAVIVISIVAALVSIQIFSYRPSSKILSQNRDRLWALFGLLGALFISFASKLYSAFTSGGDILVGGVQHTLNINLLVGNSLFNYLYFDLIEFISIPFTNTWSDIGGRQYFWNFLLKSSLFSEFAFDGKIAEFLAQSLSVILLIIVFGCLVGCILKTKQSFKACLPIVLNLIVPLCALVAYRLKIPASCNTDLRYILPVIISVCILFGSLIDNSRSSRLVTVSCSLVGGLFCLFSGAFFLLPIEF